MSWSMMALVLNAVPVAEIDSLAESASEVYGWPAEPAGTTPTARQVIDAFRAAHCHGTIWTEIPDVNTDLADTGNDLYLGEVLLLAPDPKTAESWTANSKVGAISYRKPNPEAVKAATFELARTAGPLIISDNNLGELFAMSTSHSREQIDAHWFW